MGKFIDLTGRRFEHLTVVRRVDNDGNDVQWLCKCDCKDGREVIVKGKYLRNGDTKSCGCIQKQSQSLNGKNNKRYNSYDLTGEYGIGYTAKGEEFYFDLEDYNKIKDYCWYFERGYVKAHSIDDNKKIVQFHRIVLPDTDRVDHINHHTNDNRKQNLRAVTRSQNAMNMKSNSRNTTGIIGVSWNKLHNKWQVRIKLNTKDALLGYFDDFTEAVKVRINAEQERFGEFAYRPNIKILNYINNGGILEPYNKEQIESILKS